VVVERPVELVHGVSSDGFPELLRRPSQSVRQAVLPQGDEELAVSGQEAEQEARAAAADATDEDGLHSGHVIESAPGVLMLRLVDHRDVLQ